MEISPPAVGVFSTDCWKVAASRCQEVATKGQSALDRTVERDKTRVEGLPVAQLCVKTGKAVGTSSEIVRIFAVGNPLTGERYEIPHWHTEFRPNPRRRIYLRR